MAASYDDANLVVQLLRWGTEMGLPDAVTFVFEEGFHPQAVFASQPHIRTILLFGETIGTFVKQGVLDRGLVEDLWWIYGLWTRVGPAAVRQREELGEPRLYENFEALAKAS